MSKFLKGCQNLGYANIVLDVSTKGEKSAKQDQCSDLNIVKYMGVTGVTQTHMQLQPGNY